MRDKASALPPLLRKGNPAIEIHESNRLDARYRQLREMFEGDMCTGEEVAGGTGETLACLR